MSNATPSAARIEILAVTEKSHCTHCHTPIARLLPEDYSHYRCEPTWWQIGTGDAGCLDAEVTR